MGLAAAWAVVLVLTQVIEGADGLQKALPVCAGFWIGWISTTVARYIYPPPKRWLG